MISKYVPNYKEIPTKSELGNPQFYPSLLICIKSFVRQNASIIRITTTSDMKKVPAFSEYPTIPSITSVIIRIISTSAMDFGRLLITASAIATTMANARPPDEKNPNFTASVVNAAPG